MSYVVAEFALKEFDLIKMCNDLFTCFSWGGRGGIASDKEYLPRVSSSCFTLWETAD